MATVPELLIQFENLAYQPKSSDAAVGKALSALIQGLGLKVNQFALGIAVAPLTVSRWINARNRPRAAQIKRIREYVIEGQHPDAKSEFVGLDWFFDRLVDADRIYVLKRSKPFIAGNDSRIRDRVFEALAAKKNLEVFYIFPEHASEPRRSMVSITEAAAARQLSSRLHTCPLTDSNDLFRLFWWPNLFVLHYPDAKSQGRVYDVFEQKYQEHVLSTMSATASLGFHRLSDEEVNDYRDDALPILEHIKEKCAP